MRRGYFISFEGIDGSGKSTMARLLHDHLREHDREVLLTREPGDSRLGALLRQMLLTDAELCTEAREEALLFAADRAAHVREIILPALKEGKIVLCDRYVDSTLAYQGGGRGLDEDFLRRLNDFASFGVKPDITFFFDVPLEVAQERQKRQKDKLEQEDGYFFTRVLKAYRLLAEQQPGRIRRIDATQGRQQVFSAMLAVLAKEWRGDMP